MRYIYKLNLQEQHIEEFGKQYKQEDGHTIRSESFVEASQKL